MLTTEALERAIELYEGGANESAVAEATGISHEEAKAVANALYLGETEQLLREVALAGVLEAAAQALEKRARFDWGWRQRCGSGGLALLSQCPTQGRRDKPGLLSRQ
jgi:hypothetical protein